VLASLVLAIESMTSLIAGCEVARLLDAVSGTSKFVSRQYEVNGDVTF
jgi:hypothetical protein